MAYVIRLLKADITNAGSVTNLYTASAPALATNVSNIRFAYTSGASRTVNLFFKPSVGSQIRILDKDKSVANGDILLVKPELTLAAGDAIEVTTSAALEYVVCGVEKQ